MRPDPKAAFALGLAAIMLLVCVGVGFAIDPDLLSRRVRWVARFDHVASLDEGAAVTFNGVVVGRVARVTFVPQARAWRAEFRVDRDVAPPADGGVRVEEANPLAGATLNILTGAACDDPGAAVPDTAGPWPSRRAARCRGCWIWPTVFSRRRPTSRPRLPPWSIS